MIETAIRLSELGLTPSEAEAAGLPVGADWRGDPATTADDAARWHAAKQADTEEHERAWAEHQAECRAWQAARSAAAREAGAQARAKVRGGSPGQQVAAGQQAGTEAAANFERTVPRPVWSGNGRPTVNLEYVAAEEAPGVVRRAVRALRDRLGVDAGVPA